MTVQAQTFEVASIKLHVPRPGEGAKTQPLPGGRLKVENKSARSLVKLAYRIQDFELFGGPDWAASDSYDIDAKAEGNPPLLDLVGPMLQSLLEQRFALKVHRERRELPVIALSVVKSGLKIHPAEPGTCIPYDPNYKGPPARTCGSIGTGPNRMDGIAIRMADFTRSLAVLLGRPVVDETGFGEAFDVHLTFSPDDLSAAPRPGSPDDAAPAITTALREQLGLRLDSKKAPVEVLVIDRVERPSEN